MRTLIEKELRENLRWLLVGLALIGSLLWYATPKSLAIEIRHTEHTIATMMFFGAALFAIGLGVMQSFADLRTAARSFLFHRSVPISTIFYSKLISGAIIYFATVGLPLLMVALWFASQGIDYLPVRPLQVFPAAVVALACFGFHPAAMFMLVRSGRWFGTKLLPLVYVLPMIPLGLSTSNIMMYGPAINLLIVGSILVGLLILIVAARDAWVYSVADEGILPLHSISIVSMITLSFAAVILLSISVTFVSVSAEGTLRKDSSNVKEDYAIDAAGNVWWAKSKRGRNGQQTFITGDRLRKDEVPDTRRNLPENLNLSHASQILEIRKPASCFEGGNRIVALDRQTYFDSRGNVLRYDRTLRPPLQSIVSCEGKPFAGNPLNLAVSGMLRSHDEQEPFLWIDRKGFYAFMESEQKVKTLIDMPVDAITFAHSFSSLGDRPAWWIQLTVLSDGKLHVFRLTDPEGNDWVPLPFKRADGTLDLEEFAIKEIAVTPTLPSTAPRAIRFRVIGDSKFTVILDGPRPSFLTYDKETDTSWNSTPFIKPKNEATSHLFDLTISLLPLLFSIVLAVATAIGILLDGKSLPSIEAVSYFVQDEYAFVIFAIIVMLLSVIATVYACRRRMLSRSQTVQWCCWAGLLGWATPLAVLAIYTQPTCSRCPRCEKQRRIDLRKCEHCGSEWERPAPKGIEIFDGSFSSDTVAQAASL